MSRALRRVAVRVDVKDPATLCRRIIEGHVDHLLLEELATELLPGET